MKSKPHSTLTTAIITAIATIAIAWFTFSLRQATDRLWDAGERQLKLLADSSASQSRDMQASIAVAKQSAEAAQTSADAAIAVELPIIVFTSIDLCAPGGLVITEGVPPEISRLVLGFKNSGRTVATLIDQCVEHVVLDRLPELAVYKRIYPFSPGTLVEPATLSC